MSQSLEAILPMRPAAVIFDMDGLLFDSEAIYRDAILTAARELGHSFAVTDFLKLVGRPWANNHLVVQEHIGFDHDVEEFRAVWYRHYHLMKGGLSVKAGAIELLDRLDALGIPRAICTSSSREDVLFNLNLHALTDRFDAIVAAGDYARGKPAPDPYLRAAEALGVPPLECIALEDSHNGVRAAATAGMHTIMVPDLLPVTDEIRSLCRLIVANLHGVTALLE